MKALKTGKYLADKKRSLDLGAIIISDTEYYGRREFPKHYHHNLYLAYVVSGNYIEKCSGKKFRALPGAVIFHNVEEEHSNSDFTPYSRIINLEIENNWFTQYDINPEKVESNVKSNSVDLQCCMNKISEEYLYNDNASQVEIEMNIMKIVSNILSTGRLYIQGMPKWVSIVKELLYEQNVDKLSLKHISEACGIHPAHISRDFKRYFNLSFGDYMRKIKIENSTKQLNNPLISFASIAADNGFADQSHYIRIFKKFMGITPMQYRSLI